LPAGVFNPYAGVKTSILILDKKISKERDSIFFADIKNDGFDLGAQRNSIKENDLPFIVQSIKENRFDDKGLSLVTKQTLSNNDYLLSANRYEVRVETSEYEYKSLLEVSDFHRGITFSRKDETEDISKSIKVLRANNISLGGYLNFDEVKYISNELNFDNSKKLKKNDIFICTASGSKSHIGKVAFIKDDLDYYFGGFMGALRTKEIILPEYLYLNLNSKKFNDYLVKTILGANINNINNKILKDFSIPLPSLEVQQEIVDELEGYQKIIDGCKQVVENYKPTIDIDPSWEMVELGEICELISGQSPASKYYNENNDGLPFYQGKTEFGDMYLKETNIYTSSITKTSQKGDIVMSVRAPVGPVNLPTREICIGRGLCAIRPKQDKDLFYLFNILQVRGIIVGHMGATYESINRDELKSTKIPYPNEQLKAEIVEHILEERKVIEGNKKLIEIYTQKIQDRINKVWGED